MLCAVVFLPIDACDDGKSAPSSFGQAVQIFRGRTGREKPSEDPTLFEKVFIGLYSDAEPDFGAVWFFDVDEAPPRQGRPARLLSMTECVDAITAAYDRRKKSAFRWADGEVEVIEATATDDDEA